MSFISWLFHTHKPSSPYPIKGRDDEFRATITFFYRQELGRDPDPGGMASYLHAAQYGMTGDQIRQSLHDSPEAIAYRAKPKSVTPFDPIVGMLQVRNGVFYDDTGRIRLPYFYSDFAMVRRFNDMPDNVRQDLDTGARAGWQGVRIGAPLVETEDQNGGFWAGAHSTPEMVLDVIVPLADEFAKRQMKMHLFGANNFGGSWDKERAWITALCTKLKDAGHTSTVGLFEWRNEFQITAPYDTIYGPKDADGNDTINVNSSTFLHGDEACKIATSILGCPTTMGSPGEDDNAIARSVQSTDIAGLDFGRGYAPGQLIKHCDRAYYDGRYHGKYMKSGPRGLWFLEPSGPNAAGYNFPDGVIDPLDDPAYLFGLHMRFRVNGTAVSFFNGPAVRHRIPIDSTIGFNTLPKLFQFIPEDVSTWQGPTWFTNGPEFYTVVPEEWGILERPDKPVQTWTALFYDGNTQSGTGPIKLTPGYKAVAVKGTWG